MHPYLGSPKVVIIAGPRCSGKTFIGNKIARELQFTCMSQDHIRLAIQTEHGLSSEEMFDPKTQDLYKKAFMQRLRAERYADIVIEGARLSVPFIHQAFLDALCIEYGQYVVHASFFYLPDLSIRYERYSKRIKDHIRTFEAEMGAPDRDEQLLQQLAGYIASPFDAFPAIPHGFHVVKSPDAIMQWIMDTLHQTHPDYPQAHHALIEQLAASNSNFSPFYQTVDIQDTRIIEGQTKSYLTWMNLEKLDIEWQAKQVCEIGCNNGYFLFKAEAHGAQCEGYDISEDSIIAAEKIKQYVQSSVSFAVKDVSQGVDKEYDIILALNMLHYITPLDTVLASLARNAKELVFEVGKGQLEAIFPVVVKHGHTLRKTLESHRKKSVIGDRVILHFQKK